MSKSALFGLGCRPPDFLLAFRLVVKTSASHSTVSQVGLGQASPGWFVLQGSNENSDFALSVVTSAYD
jgi:hypothetical protein